MLDASTLAGVLDMLPDPETLTIQLQNRSGAVSLTVSGCHRRPVDMAELAVISNSLTAVPSSAFLIPASGMNGHEVLAGDLVSEVIGTTTFNWAVIHAQLELQATVWRVFVARQS